MARQACGNANFQLKRIYEPAAPEDGFRVLVDRIWPRGVSKQKARVDLWLKDIAPSNTLRKWFAHKASRWQKFQERYRAELREKADLLDELQKLKATQGTVTLLYGARDQQRNQAVVLGSLLQARAEASVHRPRAKRPG